MKHRIIVLLSLLTFNGLYAQITAITEYGDEVLLYDDGTWEYLENSPIFPEAIVMAKPSFFGQIAKEGDKSSCQLNLKSSSQNDITDDEAWLVNNDLETNMYDVPNPYMGKQGNVPEDVPKYFQEYMLVRAIYSDQHVFLVYGEDFSEGRYLLIMDRETREITRVFDFSSYEYSPDYVEQDEAYINQRIDWTAIDGNVLFVSHSHSTYAASSKGMNAYITAVDLMTNEVLWRTKPLVCNSTNFVLIDKGIVCGYGFTNEKDYIYVLNQHTGDVQQTLPVKSGPSWIIRKNEEVFVRTYNTDYVFKIIH